MIGKENYILALCRYIHLNPVSAGLVSKPEDWLYSNYKDIITGRVNIDVLKFYGTFFKTAAEYQAFVNKSDADTRNELEGFLFTEND